MQASVSSALFSDDLEATDLFVNTLYFSLQYNLNIKSMEKPPHIRIQGTNILCKTEQKTLQVMPWHRHH